MTPLRLSWRPSEAGAGGHVAGEGGALDCSGQPRVDPVAGEEQAVRRASVTPGRAADRAPARTSRASRGSRCRGAAPRPARRESPRQPRARPALTSASRVHPDQLSRRRSTPATGATPVRRTPAACRRPTASRGPGRPTNASSMTCRSYQRFTVTIGFDVHARRACRDQTRRARTVRRRTASRARTTARRR